MGSISFPASTFLNNGLYAKRWNKRFDLQTILGHDAYHNNRTQIDMKKWAVAVVDLTMFEGLWKVIKFNDIKPLPWEDNWWWLGGAKK